MLKETKSPSVSTFGTPDLSVFEMVGAYGAFGEITMRVRLVTLRVLFSLMSIASESHCQLLKKA